ncbi:hypothetical protein E2562_012593, partial [Oryza meyeriana var. granulata]
EKSAGSSPNVNSISRKFGGVVSGFGHNVGLLIPKPFILMRVLLEKRAYYYSRVRLLRGRLIHGWLVTGEEHLDVKELARVNGQSVMHHMKKRIKWETDSKIRACDLPIASTIKPLLPHKEEDYQILCH